MTTNSDATVAGRRAYELTLAPRDTRSLIRSVVIAVDAETKLPLRLAVLARDGGAPAFEVGFTELSLTRPDPAQFEFNPPPGTTVVEANEIDVTGLPALSPDLAPRPDRPRPGHGPHGNGEVPSKRPPVALIGQGWTMVLAVRLPEAAGTEGGGSPGAELLELLPAVNGAWGSGRLLSTRLFTVLLTDDGRLLAGAVSPELLYEAAADPAAQLGS